MKTFTCIKCNRTIPDDPSTYGHTCVCGMDYVDLEAEASLEDMNRDMFKANGYEWNNGKMDRELRLPIV